MEKKKKSIGFKKIIVSILSILFVVCAYVPCIPKVKALTNVITYNQYGSFTRTNTPLIIDTTGNVGFGMSTVDANLQGHYSGSVTLNYTLATGLSISNFSVTCENCWITSYSSSSMNIQFNDVNHWSVTFIKTSSTGINNVFDSITINSITNWNMTFLTYGETYVQRNIYGAIDDLETQMTTNNSTLSRCETLLTTIANNGTGGGSSTVNNIDVNVGQIDVNLAYVKASTDSILSSLLGFLNDSLGQIITLETLIEHIDDTTAELQTLNTTLTNIDTTLTNMATTLTNINTAVQGIDNTIDTISWTSFTTPTTIETSKDGINYTTWDGSSSVNFSTGDVYLKVSTLATRYNRLWKITLPFLYYNSVQYDLEYIDVYNGVSKLKSVYYQLTTQQQIIVYFNIDVSNSVNNIVFKFHVKTPTARSQLRKSGNTELRYLDVNDIEYWQLVSYFDQYNMNRQLLNAIESISVNITQNDINEMNTNITEYNNTMTDINQIENNYINNFNTLNNGIDLTNDSTPSVDLINARTQFNSVFNDITGDLRIRGLLILVLVCGLILILLGA